MSPPGEAVAGLGTLLADHAVALIELNAILAHLEAILADRDAIWANKIIAFWPIAECHGNVKLIFCCYFETFRSSRLFSRLRG